MSRPGDPCGRAFYDAQGRQLAVGETPHSHGGGDVYEGLMPSRQSDRKIDAPRRPCSRCERKFQPTEKRRLLCAGCYYGPASRVP